jgi:hypothetical protein
VCGMRPVDAASSCADSCMRIAPSPGRLQRLHYVQLDRARHPLDNTTGHSELRWHATRWPGCTSRSCTGSLWQ